MDKQIDKIIIKGLRVRGKHGVTMQENTYGQEFEIDAELWCDITDVCKTDNIDICLDRKELIKVISKVVEGNEHCDTAEHLAEKITEEIFAEFSVVEAITLELKQLQPPIIGDFDYISVAITRVR